MNEWDVKIRDRIMRIAGRFSAEQVFKDWVQMTAIMIANALDVRYGELWEKREESYKNTARQYDTSELEQMSEMIAMLVLSLTEMHDALGEIYMNLGMGAKNTGQFFTPQSVSQLCARLCIDEMEPEEDGKYRIHEPACGSGGMVIAALCEMRERGINYQRQVRVVCQDLDWRCVDMCYVQLSLLGVKAVVVQGSTLSEPYSRETPEERIFRTPAEMGLLIWR